MATEEPLHDARPAGEAPRSYISPTADFLLLFGVATAVSLLTASVLL
jgi:hypothetical protein